MFQSGHEVGKYAQQFFLGGIEIFYHETSHISQLDMTQAEIRKGTKTIYEAAFSYDNVFVKVDILHKDDEGWDIIEVKNSTKMTDERFIFNQESFAFACS